VTASSSLSAEDWRYWEKSASRLQTVALILGPYRNLTTLTAAVLSLHPGCQVLNHAGRRMLSKDLDFITRYSDARFVSFCAAALKCSTGGERGDYGGSIRLSHAFDRSVLSERFDYRFGTAVMKDHPTCLVWKDSQFVTDRIRAKGGRIESLLAAAPKLRFLMPVRNPLDCALSNVRTGHAGRIPGANSEDPSDVLDKILESIAWFGAVAAGNPGRAYMFFQDDDPNTVCDGFAQLLNLSDDRQWRADVGASFDVRGEFYQYDRTLLDSFERSLERYFSSSSSTAKRLRTITDYRARPDLERRLDSSA
jgi:hypothetical protein